jgi:hypothetical protein
MPPILTNLAVARVRRFNLLNPKNKKPDCTFMQSGIRQEWRGKTGHVASIRGYGARRAKVSIDSGNGEKNSPRHGRHANAALHNCHDSPILAGVEDQTGA